MFAPKLKLVAFAVLATTALSIEPAAAGSATVPAPIVGAGLPALALLACGYWVIRKVLGR